MEKATDFAMIGDRMLVESFAAWVGGLGDLRLVAAARTVGELAAAAGARPDVVLLDALLCDRSDPVANVRRLVEQRHRVIVIDVEPTRAYITAAIGAGARGYVGKDQDLMTLARAIRTVAAGGLAYSEGLALAATRGGSPPCPRLSAREHAVLHAYVSGLTLDAAARQIGIRPATAKTYLARVKAKYEEIGRPAYTKLELAIRVREDGAGYAQP